MGRGGKGKAFGKRRGGARGGGRGGDRSNQRQDYTAILRENDKLQSYYDAALGFNDEEKADFWASMKRDLSNSFRFCGSKGNALSVQRRLVEHYIPEIEKIDSFEGKAVEPPTPVPWYPDGLAWSMTTHKSVIRRHPPFSAFQKFLVSETSVGNISRQEVVSMIPPLLMDIKRGMTVLDMCAAPGSKSCQLIEMIHKGEEAMVRKFQRLIAHETGREVSPDGMEKAEGEEEQESAPDHNDWSDDGRCTGLLIANDSDYKRCHLLVHQTKRLHSPNMVVTNHDATLFPSIRLPTTPSSQTGRKQPARYLKFDRILADVPCSGDGTLRKNYAIWKEWTPGNALGLHPTQVRILVRALQLLKVGGRVVYSTCSLNPIEDEAVVAASIERCGGSSRVKIMDCSRHLPNLKRRPGMTSWKVTGKTGRRWNDWAEVEKATQEEGEEATLRILKSNFPPAHSESAPALKNCMRVYPHLQDTGGFFICVLEKLSEIRARPESEQKSAAPQNNAPPQDDSSSDKTGAPIVAAVNELAAEKDKSDGSMPHLKALDGILPPQPIDEAMSAAARQNLKGPSENGVKRDADDGEELRDGSPKRMKTEAQLANIDVSLIPEKYRESGDDIAAPGEEDRQVHWPPPPAAMPDIEAGGEDPALEEEDDTPENPVEGAVDLPQAGDADYLPNTDTAPAQQRNGGGGGRGRERFEEPFNYLAPDHSELLTIYAFYGISERFPRDRFMVRNAAGTPSKAVYYTSSLCKDLLTTNEGTGIRFIHCGVKMFVKQDIQRQETCPWRIQNEGLPLIEGWVMREDRVVRLWHKSTLRKLLVEMFPKVGDGAWKNLGEIGEWAREAKTGCCVLRVEVKPSSELDEGQEGFTERMVLPLWRSLHSLNLMLPKEDRRAMLLRVFNEDIETIENHTLKSQQQKKAAQEAETAPPPVAEGEDAMEGDTEDGGVPILAESSEKPEPTAEAASNGDTEAAITAIEGDQVAESTS